MSNEKNKTMTSVVLRSWPVLKHNRVDGRTLLEERLVVTSTAVLIPDYSAYRYEKNSELRQLVVKLLENKCSGWNLFIRGTMARRASINMDLLYSRQQWNNCWSFSALIPTQLHLLRS